jgi:hypothetical protein
MSNRERGAAQVFRPLHLDEHTEALLSGSPFFSGSMSRFQISSYNLGASFYEAIPVAGPVDPFKD